MWDAGRPSLDGGFKELYRKSRAPLARIRDWLSEVFVAFPARYRVATSMT
jgi:hypothetical protein